MSNETQEVGMHDERKMNQIFEQIAQHHLRVTTLETRNSESLDYYELSVWNLKAALEAAYQIGFRNGKDITCS